jgi:multidrug efflux system membrane fusion protein
MRTTKLAGSRRCLKGVVVAGLVAGVLGLGGCKKHGQAQMQMPPALVTETTAVARDVPLYMDEIGRCAAVQNVTIRSQVAGEILAIKFTDGDVVKKGQLLYEIDPLPYEAALAQMEAALAQAKATLELDQTNYERVKKLINSNAVSKQEYDQDRLTVEVDKAKVKAAEANVAAAKLNLQYCYITSPVDGRAGATQVTLGNVVKVNDTTMLSIQSIDPIYADFTIPENVLPEVRRYMKEGTLKVLVMLPKDEKAAATQPAGDAAAMGDFAAAREGKLTFLDNAVQDATGTVKLRATLANKDQHFWPGQFVKVRLLLKVLDKAVLIPNQATQLGQQGSFVYVIKSDDTAEMRPIQTGQLQGDMIVIETGLKAGERVVLSGQLGVMPGAKVRFEAPATQPSAQGSQAASGRNDSHGREANAS